MSSFDPGPTGTFAALCESYPDDTIYQRRDGFRTLWGLIFYRGRVDGSARLLVIGQDPAQTEAVTRRVLSGQAGRRVQGFVEKLGFSESYLMINAFVYGIYNPKLAMPHVNDPEIQAYRHRWLEAAFAPGLIEAVVTFGNAAFDAWKAFKATAAGQAVTAHHARAFHPTADKGDITRRELLDNWNRALAWLHPNVKNPDNARKLVKYKGDFAAKDLPEIPARDFPMGLPAWMRTSDFWATTPASSGTERANISIEVPES